MTEDGSTPINPPAEPVAVSATPAAPAERPHVPARKPEKQKRGAEFDERWQPRLWSKIIVLGLIVLYGIALIVANTSNVKVKLLVTSINTKTIWLILVCFLVGLICGVLASHTYRHRKTEPKKR